MTTPSPASISQLTSAGMIIVLILLAVGSGIVAHRLRCRAAARAARQRLHQSARARAAARAAREHRHREAILVLAAARHQNPPHRRTVILVVDGDDRRRARTEEWLTSQHFQVVAADDGRRAWSLVQEARPDLVLAEQELPSLTAQQLLELIKMDLILADLPVVIRAPASAAAALLAAGANGVVDAAAAPNDLIAQIRFALGT